MVRTSTLRERASRQHLANVNQTSPEPLTRLQYSLPASPEFTPTMPDLRTAQSWQSAASSMPGSYSPQRTSAPNPSSGVGYNHMIPTATATDAATTRKPVASASPPSNTLFDSFNKSFPPLSEEDAKGNSASSSGLLARPPILAQQLNASMEAAGKELERNLQDMIKRLDYLTSGSKERLGELTGAIQHGLGKGLGTKPEEKPKSNGVKEAKEYTKRFCDFMTANPTVWHAVDAFARRLEGEGFKRLSERSLWTTTLKRGGKYYVERNGSSMVAFVVGNHYEPGNGIAMIAGHVDAVTARLKPVSAKTNKAGYVQLGVSPYAGGLNSTWWDRDLSIGGRVLVKDPESGKITTRLVKLGWPIAKVPTLAPHFGVGIMGSNNPETEAVPIIGLDNSDLNSSSSTEETHKPALFGGGDVNTFISSQPPRLVKAIASELQIQDHSTIVNWELELFDIQPATVGGLDKEFIFAGRIDDKLCSWAAVEGLLASTSEEVEKESGIIKLVGLFDDEEIGSLLRQGARGNFLPSTVERIVEALSSSSSSSSFSSSTSSTPHNGPNLLSTTYANSFLLSADVIHAAHPNFLSQYEPSHSPRLNTGLVISADSNGHMTTDSVSTSVLSRCAELSGNKLQYFMIRNDSRSGGTVGPMLSSAMGVRAVDAGLAQLSMHSVRATTGSEEPGVGVRMFAGFFGHYEEVDREFRDD